ncbi:phenylalanine--tRNA ligase beta subunit-related protein [endosymbiont GvMRE of Glomus versiforme]|uniref:phenylalanine--tRNA ligase subunit beta-related protein n=1 Tax=endosymbiont GvMRE of Glomus versiforme TaxID=2039283 RepID=UPI000ED10A8D|nr:phenylalanine--tRNA ligase beta subunit-related protein [endosymbiont GvMRE of Glomus versiforme]RHZ35379.1 Phenylalanine--tRNA ligase beta subunit [endosymbiont GvMRE of Glomus versiforme]
MISVPWKYIKEHLYLSKYSPKKIEKKLVNFGIELKIVKKKKSYYLDFNPFPNRNDLLSWRGIIHEIRILLNCKAKLIDFPAVNESKKKLKIVINTSDCHGFFLGLIRNIKIKQSPSWIKEWLAANGICSVNNITDAVNLVMLETGYRFHIFDYDILNKKLNIIHDVSKKNVSVSQKKELFLGFSDIVMSTGEKFINAEEVSLTTQTKNIIIGCVSFSPKKIKRTSQPLNTSVFIKDSFVQQANLTLPPRQIICRAILLIIKTYNGDLNSGVIFAYQEKKERKKSVIISQKFIEKKVGQKISKKTIEKIWQQLQFPYQEKENSYKITIPFYRLDINGPEDLLEELLRIYGFNKLNSSFYASDKVVLFDNDNNEYESEKKKVNTYLTNNGWQEVVTYSLVSEEERRDFVYPSINKFCQLLAPKNSYHEYYRQGIISSHLKIIKHNLLHGNRNLFFFEISSIYNYSQSEELLVLSGTGKIVNQPLHQLIHSIDFYWIKGILENIFQICLINSKIHFSSSFLDYLDPIKSAEIILEREKIGFFGQVNSQILKKYQINDTIFVAQISLSKIFRYLKNFPPLMSYHSISNFPASEKDISFLLSNNIDYNEVTQEIKKIGGSYLEKITIFDIYQSVEMKKLNQKSVSFNLIFRSQIKTLENKEIEIIINNIIHHIKELFSARLRV